MASTKDSKIEFMQNKWGEWFKALDVNHDGKVSREDYRNSVEDFENYYKDKVDDKTLQSMREGFRLFWDDFIFGKVTHKDSVTMDEFIAAATKEFQSDPEGFRKLAHRMITAICRSMDADHNGFLSLEEFVVLFRAFGHRNETIVKELFQDYGPTKDGVNVEEFAESWIDVAVGEDPKKNNIPVNGFLRKI